MLIGYGRVSTRDQNTALQEGALRAIGCRFLFIETASGAQRDRPRLREAPFVVGIDAFVFFDLSLDLAAAKQDAIKVVEQAIQALRTSGVQEDRMMWAFWQGQITTHLRRFTDLAARFAGTPEVAALLEEQAA